MKQIICILVLICTAFTLCSCTAQPEKSQFFAMDTLMSFTVYGDNAQSAIESGKKIIKELEDVFSVTEQNSIVSKINSDNRKAVTVSADILDPLNIAFTINSVCDGALDLTTLPISEKWGFLSKEYNIPDSSELELLLDNVGMEKITVTENSVMCDPETKLDFGSIAKGYAAQKVTDSFKEQGITSAIIALGGNVQTVGVKPDGSLWSVSVADPLNSDTQTVGTLSVGETAVVTSGSYQRFFEKDGKKYHHIIDPKTGYPSDSDLLSVTVICEDGTYADGLSTALFVLGSQKTYELYKTGKISFEAVMITKDYKIITTDNIKDSFTINENGMYQYANADR